MKNIFVSSTFQDMQAERDMIRQKVFPAINKAAGAHNDHIEFVDLRWGIDTQCQSEQEACITVMSTCIYELQRSDDLMIILLGDRYGWVPDSEYLQDQKNSMPGEMEYLSATAFEIEQGVFCGNKKALVYIREFSDSKQIPEQFSEQIDESRKRLEELKEKLKTSPNCRVQVYPAHFVNGTIKESDLDALARRMIQDLRDTYAGEWKTFDQLQAFDREQEIQWGFIERKAKEFYARRGELNALIENVQSWFSDAPSANKTMRADEHMHFIIGGSGSGKSTFISEAAITLRRKGYDVLPFIGGLTAESSDAIRVLCGIIYYIEEKLGLPHTVTFGGQESGEIRLENGRTPVDSVAVTRKKLQDRLAAIERQYSGKQKPLLIVIDALDQFFPDENRDMQAFCPSGLGPNIRFLITSTPDIKTGAGNATVLKKLNGSEQNLIVQGALSRRRKNLSKIVISNILKREGAAKPLYISMVLDRLMLMDQADFQRIYEQGGSIDDIVAHQNDIVEQLPDGLSEMVAALFEAAGEKIGQSFTQKALQYIAMSRQGIRESDLAYCMGNMWDAARFSRLLYYLDDQFMMRADGRIDFMHKTLRQGVLTTIQDTKALHVKLVWCYHVLEKEDSVRASELLYHCYHANEYKYAGSVVQPIVYQNFSKDKEVLLTVSRRYAQTMAELSLSDQGECVQKWLRVLAEDAVESGEKDPESQNGKWKKLWDVLWFLDKYVLRELPLTRTGDTVGGYITTYMLAAADSAEKGSWKEKTIEDLKDSIRRKAANYQLLAGDKAEGLIEKEEIFQKSKEVYGASAAKEYTDWRRMFEDTYGWLVAAKGENEGNLLFSALEPAAYGISLLSKESFVHRYIGEEQCLIGQMYGCIGELCQSLNDYTATMAAYEQDLRFREEIYRRNPCVENLYYYSGSYHNISLAYWNLGANGTSDLEAALNGQTAFFKNTKYPLKLLPFISFTWGILKTEGEIFMDRCHQQNPFQAALMARDKQIEILEKALSLKPDAKWNTSSLGHDALWYNYLLYCEMYFVMMAQQDMGLGGISKIGYIEYAFYENTDIALQRLCKALKYSCECFFDDPTQETLYNVIGVENTFTQYSKFVGYKKSYIAQSFAECIQKTETFLNACTELDSDRKTAEGRAAANGAMYARFLLDHSLKKSIELGFGTCQPLQNVKSEPPKHNAGKTPGQDIEESSTVSAAKNTEESGIASAAKNTKGVSPEINLKYKGTLKNGLREGIGEAEFPGGSKYKGEWKAGKPNGYGIKTDMFGKVTSGIFENGNLKKSLPKAVVMLKLTMFHTD